jgi:hypothetical protein
MFCVVAYEIFFSHYIYFFRMAFKKLKDVDIERFLACAPPSGSEFSDLSDDDVEITDENLFAGNQNLNNDYLSDDLCFDHEEVVNE